MIISVILVIVMAQKAFPQQAMLSKPQMQQDIDFLVEKIRYSHVDPYYYRSREEWDVFTGRLRSTLPDSLDGFDFWRKTEEIFVFMNDAHTRTYPSVYYNDYVNKGGQFIPFTIQKKKGIYYVDKVLLGNTLPGTSLKLTAVNNIPIDSLYAALLKHSGSELDFLDEQAICSSFPYYIWKVYGWQPPYSITYTNEYDYSVNNEIPGISYAALNKKNGIAPVKKEICRLSFMDSSTALIAVSDFYTRPRTYYRKFYRNAFREMNRRGIHNLIIDIRGNDGGDSRYCEDFAGYFANRPFRISSRTLWRVTPEFKTQFSKMYIPGIMRWEKFLYGINEHTNAIWKAKDQSIAIAEHKERKPRKSALRHPKRIYVLVDNDTFSAGSMFAAMVKDYRLGSLVGQPTGNLSSFYADPIMWYTMPNSRIAFQVSTSLNVRPNGVRDHDSIIPDIILPQEEDALTYVMRLIKDSDCD